MPQHSVLRVRKAERKDREPCLAILRGELGCCGSARTDGQLLSELNFPGLHANLLVAEERGAVIGYCEIARNTTSDPGPVATILDVRVSKEAEVKGRLEQMMDQVCRHLSGRGAVAVRVNASDTLTRASWEHLGFEYDGLDDFMSTKVGSPVGVWYRKALDVGGVS
jgi:hypothetical protein